MDRNNQYLVEEEGNEDIKQTLYKYLSYWPWFLVCVLITLILAGFYLRYTNEVYQSKTKIKIMDAEEGTLDFSGLEGSTNIFNWSEVNLENETQIITSRRLFTQVIEDLELNTRYYVVGQLKSSEQWKDQVPFKVEWNLADSTEIGFVISPFFNIEFVSGSRFRIFTEEEELEGNHTFGENIEIADFSFNINLNPQYEGDFNEFSGNTYGFQFLSTQEMLRILSKKIIAQPVGEQSMILELSYQGENITKNEAILNNLVKQFNQDGIEDRRAVSKRTAEFIEKRLVSLAVELDTVETKKVEYKELSDLVTLESSATQLFMKEGGAESKRYELENQLEVAKIFKEQLVNGKEYSLLPANLGIENSSVNNLTQEYNTGVLELQRLLVSATPQNPVVTHQKDMLDNIRGNIIESINTYINSLNISLQNIQLREAVTSSRLGNLPEQEKHIRNIERQQEIKERLYLFLLQKREEANLQYAITTPTIKVVDYAFTDPEAVSPKSKIILLAALILGLLIPFGILYLRFLLNTKIESKDQLKKIVGDIPVVAEIPQLEKNNAEIIRPNDRTVLAEAFRILRTNLSYMSPSRKDENQGQVIYVTSTTKGEGKTFTTVNLGITYSTTNKKVLVVGCDLRNPQLHNYIQRDKNTAGVSSYLYDENVDFDSLIIHDPLKYGNLDIILSGNIPPNPAELLMTKRFESFLNEAKSRYDYILVDTAPTILVTDTLLISSLADISVYLVRAGVTESKLLEHVKELHKHKKLRNIGIVINGLQEKGSYGYKYGYNYGYGYGYSDESPKRRFFKFWKKRK